MRGMMLKALDLTLVLETLDLGCAVVLRVHASVDVGLSVSTSSRISSV